RPLLANLIPPAPGSTGPGIRVATDGLDADGMRELLAPILESAGFRPEYPLARANGRPVTDVETYVFRNGDTTLLALQRNPPLLPDAEPPESDSAEPVVLTLPRAAFAYDVLGRRSLGRVSRLEFHLDGVEPTLLALSDTPLAPPAVSVPARLRLGDTGLVEVGPAAPAATRIVHLTVVDPAGKPVRHYSGNLALREGTATYPI